MSVSHSDSLAAGLFDDTAADGSESGNGLKDKTKLNLLMDKLGTHKSILLTQLA